MKRAAILLACLAVAACQRAPDALLVRRCHVAQDSVVYHHGAFWFRHGESDQPIKPGAPLRDICAREEP